MGSHDPTLFGDYTYQSTNLPVASTFFPSQFIERTFVGDVGVWVSCRSSAGRTSSATRRDSLQTNSLVQTLGTTYTSTSRASLTAPLLKGAWWGAAWTQVELTGIGSELALEQFRQSLMDIVAEHRDRLLEPGRHASRRSRWRTRASRPRGRCSSQTQAQYEVGVVSRVEVTEAEAGVADREFRPDHRREPATATPRTS